MVSIDNGLNESCSASKSPQNLAYLFNELIANINQ